MLKIIAHHNKTPAVHLEKVNNMKKNRLTFMSHESQDQLLCIMSEVVVHSTILKNMKKTGLFSVVTDTTTDISNQEQFSFVVWFVNENGKIEEQLLALEIVNDGTGHGLFDLFCQ